MPTKELYRAYGLIDLTTGLPVKTDHGTLWMRTTEAGAHALRGDNERVVTLVIEVQRA